jgi:oligopeptide/dipeptide ABC transporter ATP-binding protein
MTTSDDLLSVRELSVSFATPVGIARAVNDVSLSIRPGERLALVGESGSGKTVTAMSLLGLVRGASTSGQIRYGNRDLAALSNKEWRAVRGREIGIVLQDPNSSLNPTMRVRSQIFEALRLAGVSRHQREAEAVSLLTKVGINDPAGILRAYPFQLSGGQQQRIVISIALAQQPKLLIADEPTTALDVKVQAQVLQLLLDLGEQQHMSILLITHDLSVVAGFAERVAVMYGGRIVELGDTITIFESPQHPYTQGLLRSTPRADADQGARFDAIPGEVPPATDLPSGCAFRSRCPFAQAQCTAELPVLRAMNEAGHLVACHFAGQLESAKRPAESSDATA